jgi:hypothetical protein
VRNRFVPTIDRERKTASDHWEPMMRRSLPCWSLVLLVLVAGCTNTRWGFLNREREADRAPLGPPPSKEVLVAWLNNNADRLQTIRCDNLDITVHQGAIPIGLRGKMSAQKPRGFRMSGALATSPMVDLGSNDQEFWWWISKDRPPDQYYCSYDDLNKGRVPFIPFPFQPEWIMETMGLGPYGPADRYQLESDKDTLRLVERAPSPQGKMVRKVIVMKRRPQTEPNPQVVAYLLLDDATGKEICSAEISEVKVHKIFPAQVIVPRRLELRWPDAKVRLALRFDDVTVNTQLPHTVFERPEMPGVQSRDLARLNFNSPTSLQRVQGFSNR